MGRKIFESSDLQSSETFWNVLKLSAQDELDTFAEMLYHIFLWAFLSCFGVHLIAAGIAYVNLRKHKIARFVPLVFVIVGIFTPLAMSVVTSSLIAGVFRAASFKMSPLYAFFFGTGQTLINLLLGYTRILATL
ncbi:transmembrane protein 170A [Brevipalpus obovatus]|uniref:transmembrane protein 170A n=1 Tax=Brevipalpus obovatus TaxID=246614 RepID=UPI003D9E16C4